MECLDTRIKSHDKDIERMCNFHYQGFIDSIRELLQVRTQAQKLNVCIIIPSLLPCVKFNQLFLISLSF